MNRDFYWGLEAEPDDRGPAAKVPCNRVIGGTSWMTRFAVRCSPADFEQWQASGCPGWRFDDVLPYFIALESDSDFGYQPWHGDGGPIPVDRYRAKSHSEVHEVAIDALEAMGFPKIEDHNRPGALGVGRMPMSSRDGRRVSVADAYLKVGETPPNLEIRPQAMASHMLFDGSRAVGVQLNDGDVIEAGWVVVAGGVFGSPGILMRSGIGPADDLRSLGIDPLIDLPGVGRNLADHPATDLECGYSGAGVVESALHTIATFHSEGTATQEAPDLMLWLADPEAGGEMPEFTIDIVLLKPESRGWVQLRSSDPSDPPRIHLPGLDVASDLTRLVEGYRLAHELAHARELQPFCDPKIELPSDPDELRRAVRSNSYSVPHFVGTCSMGSEPDGGSVVDESSRVYGADRLSVIDASIIPIVPSGFTHLPTIMLAERLSDTLRGLL
jgi:choline dehydrogenase-like flavoprotein